MANNNNNNNVAPRLDIQRVLFHLDPESLVYGRQLTYPSGASRAFEPLVYEQIVRVPQFNSDTPVFSDSQTKRVKNLVSYLIQATGQEVSVPCGKMGKEKTCGVAGDGASKYLGCVVTTNPTVRDKVKGACGNHVYNGSDSRCSFNDHCHTNYGPYAAPIMQPQIYDAADCCPSEFFDSTGIWNTPEITVVPCMPTGVMWMYPRDIAECRNPHDFRLNFHPVNQGGPLPFHERAARFSPQYRSYCVAFQSLPLDKLWEFFRGPGARQDDFRQMGETDDSTESIALTILLNVAYYMVWGEKMARRPQAQ
ncbi:hypothetical protein B0T25DRAFT_570431 [Lasiosphaeria hispida]|uniref:Uncharacterized protein n=1 Tax=Lasiosphaeria hispida TaxID=260671 RepID=A0AAJ0MCP0_9PEZI|nr:hypothetical protein B0T25DRAFT_570431 [Lasiosphaeria hispida]